LETQDRSRWHHTEIAEASVLVERVLPRRRVGPFQIQAAISCLHGLAPTFAETDWPQIAELYELLERHQPTPVVRVNRAVAVSYAYGPGAGLALLETCPIQMVERWHLYWSTKAELSLRAGDHAAATEAFKHALRCEMNDTDRTFLQGRLASVT
jgi:RNA polymerase sigma-70 factor, ECF subfamily